MRYEGFLERMIYIKAILVRYFGNPQDRTAMFNAASLVIDAFIGIGKLILGLYLLSGWFITNALYYLILCIAKGQVLHKYTLAKKSVHHSKGIPWSFMFISVAVFYFVF